MAHALILMEACLSFSYLITPAHYPMKAAVLLQQLQGML
jgi:hypothetical protein